MQPIIIPLDVPTFTDDHYTHSHMPPTIGQVGGLYADKNVSRQKIRVGDVYHIVIISGYTAFCI